MKPTHHKPERTIRKLRGAEQPINRDKTTLCPHGYRNGGPTNILNHQQELVCRVPLQFLTSSVLGQLTVMLAG